jgi:hypothetical protein
MMTNLNNQYGIDMLLGNLNLKSLPSDYNFIKLYSYRDFIEMIVWKEKIYIWNKLHNRIISLGYYTPIELIEEYEIKEIQNPNPIEYKNFNINADYIYSTSQTLENLRPFKHFKGMKVKSLFHNSTDMFKVLLNCNWEYSEFDKEHAISSDLVLLKKLPYWKECTYMDGVILYIDGAPFGYCMGYELNKDTFYIHSLRWIEGYEHFCYHILYQLVKKLDYEFINWGSNEGNLSLKDLKMNANIMEPVKYIGRDICKLI